MVLDPCVSYLSLCLCMYASAARRLLLYIILVVVMGVSIASYWLPVPKDTAHVTAHHWRIVITLFMALSFCGGAALFLYEVNKFKSGLQAAYRWFAIGLILFGLSLFQLVPIALLGAEESFWAASGMVIIPFVLATLCMYIGMRKLTVLLKIRTILASLPVSLGLVLAGAAVSGLVATVFAPNNTPGIASETYTATVAWTLGFGLLAWMLVLKARQVIGASYRLPIAWLAIALGTLTIAGVHEYGVSYLWNESDAYIYWGASLWPFVIAGFLFIKAGYVWGLEHTGVSAEAPSTPQEIDRAYIDGILTIAALASRPQDIDAILDGLRRVTASTSVDVALTDAQRSQLIEVYRGLEAYLVVNDPLRSFTKEQLRGRIAGALRERVEQLDARAPASAILS